MLNKIFIMGRLTRDPELRRTQNGIAVTSFSLAVDRDYKSQSGEKETDFIDVVAWRNTAEFVSKYFFKGRMAIVEGRLQIRDWMDRDNNKRRSAEVVADNVYFGDYTKREGPTGGGDYRRPDDFGTPPPAYSSGGGSAPSFNGGHDSAPSGGGRSGSYSDISEEDGDLPF